jgi:UDP-N-acetylmuramate--alanine ligase
MDADHLDIYGTSEEIEKSFVEFADKIEDKNNLIVTNDLPLKGITVAVNEKAVYSAVNVRIENSSYVFDINTPKGALKDFRFGLPGRHNLMNALMAVAMADIYGTPTDAIAMALRSFKGIRRRFSYQIKTDNLVYIDDYAHHPTEINAVHQAVTELYPGKKVLAIFQPHLFSRTNDFADDFAKSLSAFDETILMEIYPARELPMEGVTSSWLMSKMESKNKKVVSKENLIASILESDATVIVTIGAGDIGELVGTIKKELNEKNS